MRGGVKMQKMPFCLLFFLLFANLGFAEPLVTIQSPTNTTYGTTSIDLNWSANETVADAFYSLNGGSNISLMTTDTFSETPDSAFNDVGTNVLSAVSTDDSNYATLQVKYSDTIDYIESNWDDANIPIGRDIVSVLYYIKHYESTTTGADLTIQWNGTGSWSEVCDIAQRTSEGTDICNLTTYIDTVSEANDVYLRYRYERISGTEYTYLNYEYLEINYTASINATITATEGANNVIVYASDILNNLGSSTTYFAVDTTPPTITIQSPTNTTYNSTSIDLNWSANETVSDAWYSLNGVGNISFPNQWQSDSAIASGLGDVGSYSTPTVFQKDGTWYLLAGEYRGIFNGFNWTGTTWQHDSAIAINSSLVGGYSTPTVFQKDGTWYLISGNNDGVFIGFNWTGTTWQSDSAIASGLGDVGSYSTPTVFQKDGTWYLISGRRSLDISGNNFNGFNWTGTTWQHDSAITSNLVGGGGGTAPIVFQKDSTWYLIAGNNVGVFNGFNWTGTTWQSDTVITSNLGDVGDYSTPTVFYKNDTWYLITGKSDGVFNGFNWTILNTTITATEGSNNVTVYANDTSSNLGSSTTYFTVDTIPPQNLALDLPYDADHTNDKQANFSWTVDYETGLTFDLVILNATDNSTVLNKTGIANQYYALLLAEELEDAEYYWYVIAYDLNQNPATSNEFYLVIDTVLPDITLHDYPKADNSTIVSTNMTLDVSFNDLYLFAVQANITNATGHLMWNKNVIDLITEDYELNDSLDFSTWTSGTYTITLYAEDDHTKKKINDYEVIKYDNEKKLKFRTGKNEIDVKYVKQQQSPKMKKYDAQKKTDRYVFDYSFETHGRYEFVLQAKEKLYYRGDLYKFPSFVTGDNWVDFNLKGEAKYEVNKVSDYEFHIYIDTKMTELSFNSLGGLNNVTEAYTFVVDNDAPLLSFVLPTPENETIVWTSNRTIYVSSNEALADNQVWLEIDGSNETMTKINSTNYYYDFNLSDGNYTYKVYANDAYGNLGVSETRTMTIDTTTPPIFSIDTPQNTTYNALSVPLDVSSSGREVVSWYFSIDYSAWDSFSPNTTLVGFEENGVYRLDVLAVDILGLNTTETVYFSLNYSGFKIEKDLTCIASDTHYVSVNPLTDDDLRWSCKLNTTDKFYCITRVYGNDENNVKDSTKLIQTNPKRKVIERYGLVDYFESVGGVSNVYFTDERLIPYANYTYEVECYSLSGAQYGKYSDIVTVEYKQAANTMAMGVWGIGNMGYLIGGFLLIMIFLIIIKLGLRK